MPKSNHGDRLGRADGPPGLTPLPLIGGAAVASPLAARAQAAMAVIGWLGTETREAENSRIVPFQQGLKEAGYIEGQNLAIEYRWAESQYDRLPALAADLVRSPLKNELQRTCRAAYLIDGWQYCWRLTWPCGKCPFHNRQKL